ncbi:LysM peptidoglycan-binding domain-containing protein [Arthrobacter sp. L77]|uniref:LysM peptidoglycan-binding domain-containing protein n=1 Tax=Arthrobacter sp. L77 TaxID=1496689 RepID=UPI001E2EDAE5|nr:LysM peptidoglycan-binding domain-containing protein [Arthrobacter sp. L77]
MVTPVLHGSSLWTPARPENHLRLVSMPDPSSSTIALMPPTFAAPSRPDGTGSSTEPGSSVPSRTSTQRSADRPLTLTRRGRLLLVGLPIALGVAALILLAAFLTSQAQAGESAPTSTATVEVSVVTGETLWDLAVRYAPERDPRDVVAEIVELNDLPNSVVQAGQSIAVPAAD